MGEAVRKKIEVAIAVVTRGKRILICQRKEGNTLGGLWEFPGGKREDGESLEACLARELMEEVRIKAKVVKKLKVIEHSYPHARVSLHAYLCEHEDGEPMPIECQKMQWVEAGALGQFEFPPANEPLLEEIVAAFEAEQIDN
jgi:mutator protein MutT